MHKGIMEFIRDVRTVRLLKLLYPKEKYRYDTMSDFELFDLWERSLPLMPHHKRASDYAAMLEGAGVEAPPENASHISSCLRWKMLNGGIYTENEKNTKYEEIQGISRKKTSLPEIVDIEKILSKNIIKCQSLSALVKAAEAEFSSKNPEEKAKKIPCISFENCEYFRPDMYRAEQYYQRKKSGDLLNDTENFVLLAELLISLLRSTKSDSFYITLSDNVIPDKPIYYNTFKSLSTHNADHISSDNNVSNFTKKSASTATHPTPVIPLINYLYTHSLFEGKIFVDIYCSTDTECLTELLDSIYPKMSLIPVLKGSAGDSKEAVLSLLAQCPKGAICFDKYGNKALLENV